MASEHDPHGVAGGPATMEQNVKSTIDDAEQTVKSTIDDAGRQAAEAARPAVEKVRSFADEQKKAGAQQIDGVAGAVHRVADELEGQLPMAARSIHDAASRLEAASTSLRDRSVEEIVTSVAEFARAQPWMVFGGAVLTGFALSRFLKSSASSNT